MNSIGRPFHFSPPPQPAPEPALPVTPTVDHTARIRNTLTAQTASFLEPLDVAHFAQTSRHNYQGSALLVKARLQHQFRDAQPFAQFGIPKRRLDTAVPLDRTGMAYLASLEITGPLAIELIK